MSQIKCESCSNEKTDRVNISRFIQKLDSYLAVNDLAGATRHLEYWESEARSNNDIKGLTAILNEQVGLFRRTGEKDKAMLAVDSLLELLKGDISQCGKSYATMLVNIATTLKAFDRQSDAMKYYDMAEKSFVDLGLNMSYEYAAFQNNMAACLCDLAMFDKAEKCFDEAIRILTVDGQHDGEIAVSLVNKAHMIFERDSEAYEAVEETLDLAWEYINSDRQPHDANYAFILSKCAPSFRYFGREIEADALEEVAKEIYGTK